MRISKAFSSLALFSLIAACHHRAPQAFAQTYQPFQNPHIQMTDKTGLIMPGGKLCTYQAGTTTPLASYRDTSGTLNANPVVGDANGYATVYLLGTSSYKLALYTAGTDPLSCPGGGTLQYTQDNVTSLSVTGLTISGNLLCATDGGCDLGASGASRFNNAYIKTNANVGGVLTLGGSTTGLSSPSVGVVYVGNGSSSDVSGLLYGAKIGATDNVTNNSFLKSSGVTSGSNGVLGFASIAAPAPTTNPDVAMSRDSSGVMDCGNGTQGNKTCQLQLGNLFTNGASTGANNVTLGPFGTANGSNGNFASGPVFFNGSYYNSGTLADQWSVQSNLGTGTSPSSQLLFSHTGSASATVYVQVPILATKVLSLGAQNGPSSGCFETLTNLGAAASHPGDMHCIADSTAVAAEGQVCVGASNKTAIAFSDGTNWKCF